MIKQSHAQLDSPHRVDYTLITYQLPLSLRNGLRGESINMDHCYLHPPCKGFNTSKTNKNMKSRINFPKSNDKIWTKKSEELEIMIPNVFTKSFVNMFFNVSSLSITSGTLTVNTYGVVTRIA